MSNMGFVLHWVDHNRLMAPRLYEMYLSQHLTDITIKCGDAEFKAHSVILAANSKYIEDALLTRDNILELSPMHPEILAKLIEFMYLGSTVVEEDELESVLGGAKKLEINGLKDVTRNKKEDYEESSEVIINDMEDLRSLLIKHEENLDSKSAHFNPHEEHTKFAFNMVAQASRLAVDNMRRYVMLEKNTVPNPSLSNEDTLAAQLLSNELEGGEAKPMNESTLSLPTLNDVIKKDEIENDDEVLVVYDEESNKYLFQLNANEGYYVDISGDTNATVIQNSSSKQIHSDESTQDASDICSDSDAAESSD